MNRYNNYKTGIEKNIFDAVWQYLIDHADIDGSGVYFVKFHTDGKKEFANHIRQRMRGVYRNDFETMTELAEYRQKTQLDRIEKGKIKKGVVEKNVMELQRKHKRPSWLKRLVYNFIDLINTK